MLSCVPHMGIKMSEELKPCIQCGENKLEWRYFRTDNITRRIVITCKNCRGLPEFTHWVSGKTNEGVTNAWNKRHESNLRQDV